jgi:hypothetical protein
MSRDWQRIVFDNSPIYVNADAKGNQPSTLKTLKDFLRPSPVMLHKLEEMKDEELQSKTF